MPRYPDNTVEKEGDSNDDVDHSAVVPPETTVGESMEGRIAILHIALQGRETTGVEATSNPGPTATTDPDHTVEEEGGSNDNVDHPTVVPPKRTIDESLEGGIPSTTPMPQIASQGGTTPSSTAITDPGNTLEEEGDSNDGIYHSTEVPPENTIDESLEG
jgi:hypothetical protein